MTTPYLVGVFRAQDLRGRRRGYRGHLPPRVQVEVCPDCAHPLFRGACPDCAHDALRAMRMGTTSTQDPA